MKASAPIRAGIYASLVWLIVIVCVWLFGAESTPRSGMAQLGSVAAILSPFALIWLAAVSADNLIELRAEADALRLVADALRREISGPVSVRPAKEVADKAPLPQKRPDQVVSEPLDIVEAVTPKTLILSLNFPDGPEDHDAVEALRLALNDTGLARLIRAAQDVITLLAGKGVYMDDLATELAASGAWRSYAAGARGGDLSDLAGVRDDAARSKVTALLQEDHIIRDAIQHFLRQYDRILAREAPNLTDGELVMLSDTRSGRAFMLLADASGNFG